MKKEIAFPAYEASELRSTLLIRAENELTEEAYEESAIRFAAAKAAKDTGSARQAIDSLRESGDIAEEDSDELIVDIHIQRAAQRVQRGRVATKLRDQTMHEQLIVEALAQLEADKQAPARSKAI